LLFKERYKFYELESISPHKVPVSKVHRQSALEISV